MYKFFCALMALSCLFISHTNAQYQLKGKVTEKNTEEEIAFVRLKIDFGNHQIVAFTDVDGNFSMNIPEKFQKIHVYKFGFEPLEVHFNDTLSFYQILLNEDDRPFLINQTDQKIVHVVQNMLALAKRNNPLNANKFELNTYNKLTVSSGDVAQVKHKLDKILKKFTSLDQKVQDSDTLAHHLVLMESVSQRSFASRYSERETIIGSKAAGIEKPSVFAISSQMQSFTVYDKHLYFGGQEFVSPLFKNAHKWYNFSLLDQVIIGADTLWTLYFSPVHHRQVPFLKGTITINSNNYAVQYVDIRPNIDSKMEVKFQQAYQLHEHLDWFPVESETLFMFNKKAAGMKKMTVKNKTSYTHLKAAPTLKKNAFDQYWLRSKQINLADSFFWKQNRAEPLSATDSNTYFFYDHLGNIKHFEKAIRFGESLLYGQLPLKYVNLDVHRMLAINRYEGFRVGLGLHSNDLLSKKVVFGAFAALGLLDNQMKGGVDGLVFLDKDRTHKLYGHFLADIREAGGRSFAFKRTQHSNEKVREFNLLLYDFEKDWRMGYRGILMRYLNLDLSLFSKQIKPTYFYTYIANDQAFTDYTLAGYKLSAMLAFRERYMKLVHADIAFSAHYPYIWLEWERAFSNLSDFDYTKIDFKFQHKIRFVGYGTLFMQACAGWVTEDLPYGMLYNMQGSYRPFSAVANNSFETMYYNEFLSDRYVSFHFMHTIGKIQLRKINKQPNLQIIHNIGFGALRNRSVHQQIDFKTMEHGFFESGIYSKNILVLNIYGLNLGVGSGIFYRYGAYAYPTFSQNLLWKFAIDFQF